MVDEAHEQYARLAANKIHTFRQLPLGLPFENENDLSVLHSVHFSSAQSCQPLRDGLTFYRTCSDDQTGDMYGATHDGCSPVISSAATGHTSIQAPHEVHLSMERLGMLTGARGKN